MAPLRLPCAHYCHRRLSLALEIFRHEISTPAVCTEPPGPVIVRGLAHCGCRGCVFPLRPSRQGVLAPIFHALLRIAKNPLPAEQLFTVMLEAARVGTLPMCKLLLMTLRYQQQVEHVGVHFLAQGSSASVGFRVGVHSVVIVASRGPQAMHGACGPTKCPVRDRRAKRCALPAKLRRCLDLAPSWRSVAQWSRLLPAAPLAAASLDSSCALGPPHLGG